LGQVIMSVNYNAAAPSWINAQQAENCDGAVSAAPDKSFSMFVECSPSVTSVPVMYVRTQYLTTLPQAQDLRLFDWGNFQVSCFGSQQGGLVLGRLFAVFDIELILPILNREVMYGTITDAFGATGGISPTGGDYFGANPLPSPFNTLDGILIPSGSSGPPYGGYTGPNCVTYDFPIGTSQAGATYLVTALWKGSTGPISPPSILSVGPMDVYLWRNPDQIGGITDNVITLTMLVQFQLSSTSDTSEAQCSLVFYGGVLPSAGTLAIFIVNEFNSRVFRNFPGINWTTGQVPTQIIGTPAIGTVLVDNNS